MKYNGPWSWQLATDYEANILDVDGNLIATVYIDSYSLINTELIVAAPDLIEALDQLARLGNGSEYGNSKGNLVARCAIAKISGEDRPSVDEV